LYYFSGCPQDTKSAGTGCPGSKRWAIRLSINARPWACLRAPLPVQANDEKWEISDKSAVAMEEERKGKDFQSYGGSDPVE
jgi:hypothetical protein